MSAAVDLGREVRITAEPVDGRRCRFVVDRAIHDARWVYFRSAEEAKGAPLAEQLFTIEGVVGVLIAHDSVTIDRQEPRGLPIVGAAGRVVRRLLGDRSAGLEGWPALGKRVGERIRAQLATGEPAVPDPPPVIVPSPEVLRGRVQAVLDAEVNPVIAGHGGGVTILDLKDNVLYLQMWGGCQGCGLADMTLKNGVEAALRDSVPEIGKVIDLTDHASGQQPYHRPRR